MQVLTSTAPAPLSRKALLPGQAPSSRLASVSPACNWLKRDAAPCRDSILGWQMRPSNRPCHAGRTRPRMSTAARPTGDLLALCSHSDKLIREDSSPCVTGTWARGPPHGEATRELGSSKQQHTHRIARPANVKASLLGCRETFLLRMGLQRSGACLLACHHHADIVTLSSREHWIFSKAGQ